jgi:hypothetical protein
MIAREIIGDDTRAVLVLDQRGRATNPGEHPELAYRSS